MNRCGHENSIDWCPVCTSRDDLLKKVDRYEEMNKFALLPSTDIYKQHGYANRETYFKNLADNFGIDNTSVFALAQLLGSAEDFDGLVSDLEDFSIFM